jgi:hypothetical protein
MLFMFLLSKNRKEQAGQSRSILIVPEVGRA